MARPAGSVGLQVCIRGNSSRFMVGARRRFDQLQWMATVRGQRRKLIFWQAESLCDNPSVGNQTMMRMLVVSVVLFGLSAANVIAEDKVDFEKQILPILKENCEKCHGEKKALGKMRLHTAAALKEKWEADKKLIVAGEPEKSELYERLTLPKDDKKRMPKAPAEPLAKDKIDLISRWSKEVAVLPLVAAVDPKPAEPKKEEAKKDEAKKEEPKKEAK